MPSHDHRHCDDWGRAHAGAGLPALEPGMPDPAGTGMTRRSLLLRGTGLALAVFGGGALHAQAVEEALAAAGAGGDAVLVSIFLDGGADGMSILAPTGDPRYAPLRPTLALSPDAGVAFADDDRLRWHPLADGLRALWDDPETGVAVLPAVGYAGPNQSHFTSRHFWEVGALDVRAHTGWLGRYLDRIGSPDVPIQGLSLDGRLSPALATARVPVAAAGDTEFEGFGATGVWGAAEDRFRDALRTLGTLPAADPALAVARRQQLSASDLAGDLALSASADETPAGALSLYPGTDSHLEHRLRALAKLLTLRTASGGLLPMRVVTLNAHGGWDTHSGQASTFADNAATTMRSVRAFWRDLQLRGAADRVVVLLWSEFGRRAQENGSRGTDHGAAGAGFVIGSRVRQGLVGEFPGLATGRGGGLDDEGNLRATSDFRALYCSLLRGHLGTDPEGIIPGADRFAGMELFA